MRVLKVAVGNSQESFIESRLSDGINIISSDDNNRGKTIVVQSMMYALGNEPSFPASFNYKDYYYYVEFEEGEHRYKICRSANGFVLRSSNSCWLFENVSELKRFWTAHISNLPMIVKNNRNVIVDPVLFFQLFFIGQDKKDTSNIAHHGYYNKNDFVEMLCGCCSECVGISSSQEDIDSIKQRISSLKEEKKILLAQNKILKSKHTPTTYLFKENDRLAFAKKVEKLNSIQDKIFELRGQRISLCNRKLNWSNTIRELKSLNKAISCGQLMCAKCGSTDIALNINNNRASYYSFDLSTPEMRAKIIESIENKIESLSDEVEKINSKVQAAQAELQSLLRDDEISLESIVYYKRKFVSADEVDAKIDSITSEIIALEDKLFTNQQRAAITKEQRRQLLDNILEIMNAFYCRIDPSGNLTIHDLFTKKGELYSGSEATIFHIVKLLAIKNVLKHNYPIIIDSFRAEDLSTEKEDVVLELLKETQGQVILTTTLKKEEVGKYSNRKDVNHIDYQPHLPSKLLKSEGVEDFKGILKELNISI